jgi:UDP-2,4-diacetamido-2,4,6-trideoxy-beta-L-altropyranose hydrolase
MHVAFRVDASQQIGTGHVMRCLSLAEELRKQGVDCRFICRCHPGNLIDQIRQGGFLVHALPFDRNHESDDSGPIHAKWIGVGWKLDADQTKVWLGETVLDWLIVDHYGLDDRWEREMLPHYHRLMVIDDLADRPHACHLLLDQTYGRDASDYSAFVPVACRLLCGTKYALLRPEFGALRSYSLQRRVRPALRDLLISLGGVDKDNVTCQVLEALRSCQLLSNLRITVVLGSTAPWRDEVRKLAENMPWPTRVLIGVKNVAQLMAESDLAIGAAGGSSWERCCLGLPTIMLVLADNQRKVAQELTLSGAAISIDLNQVSNRYIGEILAQLTSDPMRLHRMSKSSATIVNGSGVSEVIYSMNT